jgi:hypothetical protein
MMEYFACHFLFFSLLPIWGKIVCLYDHRFVVCIGMYATFKYSINLSIFRKFDMSIMLLDATEINTYILISYNYQ